MKFPLILQVAGSKNKTEFPNADSPLFILCALPIIYLLVFMFKASYVFTKDLQIFLSLPQSINYVTILENIPKNIKTFNSYIKKQQTIEKILTQALRYFTTPCSIPNTSQNSRKREFVPWRTDVANAKSPVQVCSFQPSIRDLRRSWAGNSCNNIQNNQAQLL